MAAIAYLSNCSSESVIECRMAKAQSARTHCPRGHPYDCVSGGRRRCLACKRERYAASRAPKPTRADLIWARVDRGSADACWPWTGPIDGRWGYGLFNYECQTEQAHRVVYELVIGPIPDGLDLDHTCHNEDPTCGGGVCEHRRCVNPAHMEPATRAENVMRGKSLIAELARRTHCPQGHPYNEANTWTSPNKTGGRQCRICNRDKARAARARKRG